MLFEQRRHHEVIVSEAVLAQEGRSLRGGTRLIRVPQWHVVESGVIVIGVRVDGLGLIAVQFGVAIVLSLLKVLN